MAIKRCPYCKAIIEEDSGFCSNCGTRLLFPEDEFEEEEIPGDKIDEEEEAPSGQPEEVEPGEEHLEQGEEEKEEAEAEREIEEEEEERAAESEGTEKREVEGFVESIKRERAEKAKKEAPETLEEIPQGLPEKTESARESALEREGEKREEGIKEETQPESGQIKFKTEELEQIPDARTKERENIERLLASLRRGAAKFPPPGAKAPPTAQEKKEEGLESPEEEIATGIPGEIDTAEKLFIRKEIEEGLKADLKAEGLEETRKAEEREREEINEFLESVKRERAKKTGILEEKISPAQKKISEESAETGKEFPPWAERAQKGKPLEVEVEEEREAAPELGKELQEVEEEEAEEEAAEEEIAVPRNEVELKARMEQIGLPFEPGIEEERVFKRRGPSKLSMRLKSRAFDLLSIAVLWIISLWLASRLIGVSLFKLISASALQSLAFYLVLLVIYFSFFILLLGETLGDLIFSREK